ncbi:sodium:solute symporter family protein [Neolewinella lacunae]|uniref:Sodium:solute symporter family protein n=1 Tax=Neolewinella lacunae TaxID=1517758 RepID=A0A923PHA6_9BACT|nr:sodium:solute symporter family protein [Neolewinella lacunae]MBC6992600.1 sodium:solute symporter family protein [Neolewinella lacunae]MDN3634341.1 sodium:solute symporter family protein [Neolewinella lacunae]
MKPFLLLFGMLGAAAAYLAWFTDQSVNWPAFGSMAAFYALVYYVGARAAGRREADADADGLMLAGRNLPLWVAIFTMSATWVGGGFINGTAEYTATSGLVWVQAPWGYALSLIVGGLFLARPMRRRRYRTMLDPLEDRYGKRLTALLFLPALTGELFWTAAILTALGATFGTVLGIDLETSILLSAAIAVAYTALGGLWAVALTDVVQLGILLFGLAIIVPFALEYTGGLAATYEAYQEKFGAAASFLPSREALGNAYWTWWDSALLLVFGGIPWQVYFQRVLAARDERSAVILSLVAGGVCLLAAVAPVLIGMVSATVDWSAVGSGPPTDPAATLPWVVRYLTNPTVAVIGLGAVAAAVMSSVDSSVLSASSMGIWNVYRPLMDPGMSDKRLVKLIQRCIWIVGVAATLIAFQVKSVYALWFLCSDFVYCLLFPALVCAIFDPQANRHGALAGFLVAAFLRFGGGDATLGLPEYLPYPEGFPFRTLAMGAGLLTIVLVSRLVPVRTPPKANAAKLNEQ